MNFKKILVAVDGSANSERAVRYAGEIIGSAIGFEVKLVCVERVPERDLFPDEKSWKKAAAENDRHKQEFLKHARGILEDAGIGPDKISEEYVTSCGSPVTPEGEYCSIGTSVAKEIMRVQQEGGYGTVALGRRGMSKAEEFLFGSVTTKVIHLAKDCTVWVVE